MFSGLPLTLDNRARPVHENLGIGTVALKRAQADTVRFPGSEQRRSLPPPATLGHSMERLCESFSTA
jgi:hypothetical protein